ncbi:MAG: TVP38/TMEM64 family protein [Thermodesulfobacteriota bacterium]
MAFWLIIIAAAITYLVSSDLGWNELHERLGALIKLSGPWAPFTYIAFYSFRSLVFFPASVLTIIAGILFGPWFGLIFTIVGENISANVSFVVGRYFVQDFAESVASKNRFINKTFCRTRKNGFMTVLIMRLSFVPFDLVGYFSGICNIRQKEFALGTLLGTIPGLLTYTMLGSSVANINLLFVALATLIISLLIALFLRKTGHSYVY